MMLVALAALGSALASLLVSAPLPPRLVADADDVYALRYNPAGLGFIRGSDLRFLYTRSSPVGREATNGGSVFGATTLFGGLTLGAAYELGVVPGGDTEDRASIGLGLGGPSAALGFSYEHYSPVVGIARNVWSAGLTLRPASWLSAAIAVHDIGQRESARFFDLGLAFHAISDRILLSGRWRITRGLDAFADRDLAARIDVEAIEGVSIGGGVNFVRRKDDTDFGAFGGLTFSIEHLIVGSSYQDLTTGTELVAEVGFKSPAHPSALAHRKVAVMDLDGALVPDPKFNLFKGGFEISPYGAIPLLLDEMARSDRVSGVFLRIGALTVGWGKAQEVRGAIKAVIAAGKRVDCSLMGAGDLEYFVASACSSVLIAPAQILDVNGVAANVVFLAGALEKLGIDVDVVQRGRYKSSPEAFTRSSMSPAQREALGAYMDRIYDTLVGGIAEGRKLDRAQVEQVIARGSVTATEAVALHLADKIVYPDEIEQQVDALYGHHVSYADASSIAGAARMHWGHRPRLALISVDAAITGGESKNAPLLGQTAGAETLVGALEAARGDPSILAVVLRVDSPGGDAFASDLIGHAVKLLDDAKPVIVSFGDVAASGGYYVAAPARAIYAEPTTLTGSIGVFSLAVSGEKLLSKLGISADAIERGPLSNAQSFFHDPTPEGHRLLERQVEAAYREFLETVAKGRHKPVEEIRQVAEGRIWSGADAKSKGLVDEMGGLLDALRRAKSEVGLDADETVELISLPANRAALPISVRTTLAEDALTHVLPAPDLPERAVLEHVVPHGVSRAIAPLLIGPRAKIYALPEIVLDID